MDFLPFSAVDQRVGVVASAARISAREAVSKGDLLLRERLLERLEVLGYLIRSENNDMQ